MDQHGLIDVCMYVYIYVCMHIMYILYIYMDLLNYNLPLTKSRSPHTVTPGGPKVAPPGSPRPGSHATKPSEAWHQHCPLGQPWQRCLSCIIPYYTGSIHNQNDIVYVHIVWSMFYYSTLWCCIPLCYSISCFLYFVILCCMIMLYYIVLYSIIFHYVLLH
jgi:hypothetical protein